MSGLLHSSSGKVLKPLAAYFSKDVGLSYRFVTSLAVPYGDIGKKLE